MVKSTSTCDCCLLGVADYWVFSFLFGRGLFWLLGLLEENGEVDLRKVRGDLVVLLVLLRACKGVDFCAGKFV